MGIAVAVPFIMASKSPTENYCKDQIHSPNGITAESDIMHQLKGQPLLVVDQRLGPCTIWRLLQPRKIATLGTLNEEQAVSVL